jgi:hypothetical protein
MMMKSMKLAVAIAVLATATMFGPAVNAQTFPFVGAGSSAAFNALAFAGEFGTSPVCGIYNWSQNKGFVTGHDNRTAAGASDVAGTVWVEWNTSSGGATGPVTTICAYLNIDSIVGNRLFFAQPQGSVNFPGGCPSGGIAPSSPQQVPLLPADVTLPVGVCNALNGHVFNAAPSDIRPEDAAFGTARACAAYTATSTGLGYGGTGASCSPGLTITSGFGSAPATAQPIAFNISGTDPITGTAIPAYKSLNVGGQILLVLANAADTSDGGAGLGNAAFNNVNRWVLAEVYNGTLSRTRDLIPGGESLPAVPIDIVQREPLSGTMNTIEFQIFRNKEIDSSQELLINPNAGAPTGWTGTTDPLDITKTKGGARKIRAIGTGEMIKALAGTTTPTNGVALKNQIGYAFFSYGNVAPLAGLGKYFAVDGVDPLYADYASNPGGGGALPTCTVSSGSSSCNGAITFPNIVNGTYPLWNVLRVITTTSLGASGGSVSNLVNAAQAYATSFIPDFVPYANLAVFRAHHSVTLNGKSVAPHDGFNKSVESGGDASGAVFTVEAELDYQTDTNKELINLYQ